MREYDRGDGVCKYLNSESRCSIYDHRPEICNTDILYEKYFSSSMSREEYDRINKQSCDILRGTHNDQPEKNHQSPER